MNVRPGIRGSVVLALTAAFIPASAWAADPSIAPVTEHPVIDPAKLATDPALGSVEPAAIRHPAPGIGERWRHGLADIEARFESDLAALRGRVQESDKSARAETEQLIQARKLEFEIELLNLQIALLPLAETELAETELVESAAARPDNRDVVESLRASVALLENLRQRILDGGPAVVPAASASGLEE